MKKRVRDNFLLRRREITSKRRKEAKETLYERLLEITKDYQNVLSYSPLLEEVCVDSFNKFLQEKSRLLLPKIIGQTLIPCRVTDMEKELKTHDHKFKEPIESCKKEEKIDVVIVPGVAFDLYGGRVGFGKGFYDRFLEQKKIHSIGVCFKEQVFEGKIPLEAHDVIMEELCIV